MDWRSLYPTFVSAADISMPPEYFENQSSRDPPVRDHAERLIPKIGNINVCVQTASAYPTKIFVRASTNDIATDCCILNLPPI
jgi:hypothetical protein